MTRISQFTVNRRFLKILMLLTLLSVFLVYISKSLNFEAFKSKKVLKTNPKNQDMSVLCRKPRFFTDKELLNIFERERSLKPVGLVSFPGSGNTWLRYLLQQATGILTGSVYNDIDLMMSSFPGEGIQNSTVLVVKTHEYGAQQWNSYRRAILLVREPEEAILAEFHRQHGGHIGTAPKHLFHHDQTWRKFVHENLKLWTRTNLQWCRNFPHPLKITFYSDLLTDLQENLKDILRFLQHPIDSEALACTGRKQMGIFKRKKMSFNPYTQSMKRTIRRARNLVFNELKK